MKSVNKQVSTGMMSTASATNYYARALQLLGFQTTNVTTKEAIRQLKYIGLWKTLKGLSAEEQKRILMGIYNNEQLVQEIMGTTALASANNTLSFSFKGLTASIRAMMASNPLGWIMMAISAVIELVSWLGSAEEEVDELAKTE